MRANFVNIWRGCQFVQTTSNLTLFLLITRGLLDEFNFGGRFKFSCFSLQVPCDCPALTVCGERCEV